MNKYLKIVFFIIGFAIFYYLLQNFGFDKIVYNLKNSGITVFYAVLVWFFAYLLNAYCYYKIVNDNIKKISFTKSFNINLVSFALNYITPFINLGGEAFRIVTLKDEIGKNKAISSTLLYNILHSLSLLLLWISGAICLVFIYPQNALIITAGLTATIVIIAAIIFLIAKNQTGLINSLLNLFLKIKPINKYFLKNPNKLQNLLQLDTELTTFYKTRKTSFYKGLAAEYLSRVITSFEFYFILSALNINVDFFMIIYLNAISSLMLNFTFFIPMELGTREASMYLIMGSVSGNSSIGVFIAVINRLREFFWIFTGLVLMQFIKISETKQLETQENT